MPVINLKTGREFEWAKSRPSATTKARWHKKSMYGKTVYGSVRHIAHLDRLNNLSTARFGKGIVIIQPAYSSTVAASAGTHDYDACVDLYIPGISWWTQQRFFRAYGLGCWYRPTSSKWSNHIHGFTLPPHSGTGWSNDFAEHGFKVGKYVDGGWSTYGRLVTSSQINDYAIRAFGLANQHRAGSDRSWHPSTHRKGGIQSTIFNLNAYIERRKARQAR